MRKVLPVKPSIQVLVNDVAEYSLAYLHTILKIVKQESLGQSHAQSNQGDTV
jgi:hypothetical protein